MDDYNLMKRVTELADGELGVAEQEEVKKIIDTDKRTSFEYRIQVSIRENLAQTLIMHPVPFKLRLKGMKKLEKV
jgi:hypothetical protein